MTLINCYYNNNHFTALWTTQFSQHQKKHSPTHTYRGHQSSLICFLHRLWSKASSLFNMCACQSFSTISVQVLFGLPLGQAPPLHTTYISSTIIVFFSHHILRPSQPVCCSTEIMSSNPSLSEPFTWNSIFKLNATHLSDHSHLCLLKFHLIFFSYSPGHTSM